MGLPRRPPAVKRGRAPIAGLLYPAYGPLVRGRVVGEGGVAEGLVLVDTGASMSAVDRDIARTLRLPTHGAARWQPIGGDPHEVAALRRARLELLPDPRHWELDLIEVADLSSRVSGYVLVALLGWDFLDQCTITIDGPSRTFRLELPRS
ncbi:MAG: hypothetical protein R3F59_17420 [Myxococcota bacterium]